MGQKGSTEQSRIKNILSNHAGLQVPLWFFLQASRLCNQHSIYEKGGKGGAPMSMARLCFLQVLIYYPRDFSPVLRFIPSLKKQLSKFQVRSE